MKGRGPKTSRGGPASPMRPELTVEEDVGALLSGPLVPAQLKHHCVLLVVGTNHERIDVRPKPCEKEPVCLNGRDSGSNDEGGNVLETWWENRPGVWVRL